MDDRDIRNYEMVLRVRDLSIEEASFFPASTMGGELFAKISARATELGNLIAQQVSGSTSARQGTGSKSAAREALHHDLERLRRTARSMSKTIPGIDSKFRIPRNLSDQQLIGVARASAADAIPFKNDFIRFAMPREFLDELNQHIADFETALTNQQTGKGHQVSANAAFDDRMAEVLSDIAQVDPIVRNTFQDDPGRLAKWMTARHVERSPRKKKEPGTPEKQ
jgi:hypothetical protein